MSQASPTVLITGAASGIGWATAQEFAAVGWRVILADLDVARARSRVDADSDRFFAVALDVCDTDSVERAFDTALARWGRLDALVNNAGIQRWSPLRELDWEAWSAVLEVNLNGAARALSAAGRRMCPERGGAIVNIVSVNGERGVPLRAPYSVSKAGLLALTRTAAIEWAPRGIRVNAVGPGYVATEMMESFVASGQIDPAPILARIPLRRMAEPAEIARAVRFLASEDASYVTGQALFVDGGFLADSGLPGQHQDDN
jgi:3-oxoacyl-[acyl-carrier protein] reductase